ncbi:MAG: recombination regulator RecX [Deltaproteobacteria bacterium]|nr:recombination regulator RecX [Deltaproteobacteria bacterium]
MLALRAHSEAEIREKLVKKGFDGEEQDTAVKRLKEHGYINDENFALNLASSRLRSKNWGMLKIQAELRRKGVADETVKTATASIGKDDELASAIEAAGRYRKKNAKRAREMPEREFEMRTARFLASRGFSYDAIKAAIKSSADDGE